MNTSCVQECDRRRNRRYNPAVAKTAESAKAGDQDRPQPSRRGAVVAAGLAILTIGHIAATRYSWLETPLQTDVAIWAYSGWRMLDGADLYSDLWDNKPPGMHCTFAVMQWLFGSGSERPFFWLDAVVTAAVCLLTYRLGRRFASPAAAAAGVFLLSLVFCHRVLADWALNAEKFVALFEVVACTIAVSIWGRRGFAGRWMLAGACCGMAVLYKQGGVLCLSALVISLVWTRLRRCETNSHALRSVQWLVLGAAVPWVVAGLVMANAGNLGAFWHQVVAYDAARIGSASGERGGLFESAHWERVWESLRSSAILFGPAVIGIVFWVGGKFQRSACPIGDSKNSINAPLLPVMAYAVLTFGAYPFVPFGFGHYLLQAAPPAALIAAWWVDRMFRRQPLLDADRDARPDMPIWMILTASVLVAGGLGLQDHARFTFDPDCDARRAFAAQRARVAALAGVVMTRASPDESVLLWPPDYPAQYYSQRRSALEWSNPMVIFMGRGHRLDPPMSELLSRLAANPPNIIVDWTPVAVDVSQEGQPELLTPAAGFSLAERPNPDHRMEEGRLLASFKVWVRENYGGQQRVGDACTVYYRDRPWRDWRDVLLPDPGTPKPPPSAETGKDPTGPDENSDAMRNRS